MKRSYEIVQAVDLELIEGAFTPEFLAEYRQSFFAFSDIQDHARHLSQMIARGLISSTSQFVEGYGTLSDFVRSFKCEVTHNGEAI